MTKNYSQQAKLLKIDKPILMFALQLDGSSGSLPGLNQGRLTLWDYDQGYIHRWVASSSHDGKQVQGGWDKSGGIHPPNYMMDGAEWFRMETKLIIQPGCPVDEGYLLKYQGSNNWTTLNGVERSEIMCHCDSNYQTNPGSMGCIVMRPNEWSNFKDVIKACCGHLEYIPYGISYLF